MLMLSFYLPVWGLSFVLTFVTREIVRFELFLWFSVISNQSSDLDGSSSSKRFSNAFECYTKIHLILQPCWLPCYSELPGMSQDRILLLLWRVSRALLLLGLFVWGTGLSQERVIGTWQVIMRWGLPLDRFLLPGGYPQPPNLTSWTVCLRGRTQSIVSYCQGRPLIGLFVCRAGLTRFFWQELVSVKREVFGRSLMSSP